MTTTDRSGLDRRGVDRGRSDAKPSVPPQRRARTRAPLWAQYLVAGGLYLVLSLLVWWQVWTTRPSSVMTCSCTDAGRAVWYLEWTAFALSHGHNLWYSNWLFHPGGFNILSDTSVPAIGLVMTPITLLFGPVASINVASTLVPVLTALSTFWLLRRWVRWTPAAFIGGLVYGFSPFVLVQLAYGWLNLATLALLPLMVACIDELVVRQRARPTLVGGALGLLLTIEFFVSSELVLIVIISGVIAIGLLAVYAAVHDLTDLRRRLPYALTGILTGAVVVIALLAYPVWFFLHGPAHLGGGPVWSTDIPGNLGNTLSNFWSQVGRFGPVTQRQLAGEAPVLGGYEGPPFPSPSYLGLGLLIVLVAGTVWRRHDRRLWFFGALGLVTAALSLRVGGTNWGPWSLVYHLPLFNNVVQERFSAVIDLCAVVMLAVILDRVRTTVMNWSAERQPITQRPNTHLRRAPVGARSVTAGLAALVVAAVAIVPIGNALASNLPLRMQAVVVPRWFTEVAPHLPPGQVVLTYPFATADSQSAIPWQAIDKMHYLMAGGGGPAGTVAHAGAQTAGFSVLAAASLPLVPAPTESQSNLAAVRRAVQAWGVTMVVVPGDAGLPTYQRARGTSFAVGFFTAVLGSAPVYQAGAWVWPEVKQAPPPVPISAGAFSTCTTSTGVAIGLAPAGGQVAQCVLRAGG